MAKKGRRVAEGEDGIGGNESEKFDGMKTYKSSVAGGEFRRQSLWIETKLMRLLFLIFQYEQTSLCHPSSLFSFLHEELNLYWKRNFIFL